MRNAIIQPKENAPAFEHAGAFFFLSESGWTEFLDFKISPPNRPHKTHPIRQVMSQFANRFHNFANRFSNEDLKKVLLLA